MSYQIHGFQQMLPKLHQRPYSTGKFFLAHTFNKNGVSNVIPSQQLHVQS